jgi:hypothetical protein
MAANEADDFADEVFRHGFREAAAHADEPLDSGSVAYYICPRQKSQVAGSLAIFP